MSDAPAAAVDRDHADRADPADRADVTVDTPARLTRWQALGTAALALFGLAGATVLALGHAADGRAAGDTEQLVRVQQVQSSLLRADAVATTALLAGEGAPEQPAAYDVAIDAALTGITEAAEAQPADSEELVALTVAVNDYVTAVASATTDAGVAAAGETLRAEALPLLTALVADNTSRAEDAMAGQQPWLLLAAGLVALGTLVWVHRRLARAFRRHVNVGLLLAALVVVATTAGTTAAAFAAAASNEEVRDGPFRTAVDQAAARTAANDAKANESLRLVQGGSGADQEAAWRESAEVVAERGAGDAAPLWQDYVAQHERILALLADGDRDGARQVATAGSGGSTAALDAYDEAAQQETAEAAAAATDELRGDRWVALLLAGTTVLAAAAAAGLLARGIGVRRREFA
ncbi:hypothetical protein KUV85_02030 [Nocardioides panacisoli]|uniref:hypothetical protein n=1 Tax=Nocardioides panacisoli TaxID=627624 RepID=UPI001C632BE5|nr:hypothetical protein [Nocardioides panacisoli]QYJ04481.1 hypothetical protein KUV85_02030 [Nocardioides panacisoli]